MLRSVSTYEFCWRTRNCQSIQNAMNVSGVLFTNVSEKLLFLEDDALTCQCRIYSFLYLSVQMGWELCALVSLIGVRK